MQLNRLLFQALQRPKTHATILLLAWCLLHLVLLFHFGIVTGFESRKYIEQADNLLRHGTYTSPNFLFYSTEILLVTASKKLQTGYWIVVAVQLLFNLASTYAFYKIVAKFTKRATVACFFTLTFIAMFYYQLYNVSLFTESLYFSFSVLFFYRLLTFQKLRVWQWLQILLLLTLLYFTRPVGLFFIPATFTFLVLKFFRKKARLIFFVAGFAILGFLFLLNNSMSAGGEFDFLLPYTEGQIICGVPSGTRYSLVIPVEKNTVQGLFYLIIHYPALFFSLFFKRLLAFFGVVRPYYSLSHNLFAAFFFYSLYMLVAISIRKWLAVGRPAIFFLLMMIVLTALATGLSCDEWHGRFIYAVFPFLMMLASLAFKRSKDNKSDSSKSNETL